MSRPFARLVPIRVVTALPPLLGVALLLVSAGACTSTPTVAPSEVGLTPIDLPDIDEKALLLLLVDRQIYEGFVVNRTLEGDAEMRRLLAIALGRADAPSGRPVLERLASDPEVEVRRAATFALGELGEPLAEGALLRVARSSDRQTGLFAVEALGKLGVDLGTVVAALSSLDEDEQAARVVPSLYRFEKGESLLPAARWLALADRHLHAMAAYALARGAIPEALPYLRPLLADADPWVRGWAARALGSVGTADDLGSLRALLADAEEGPVIQALRSGARLKGADTAGAGQDWAADLARLMSDPRTGVRLTAVEAAGAWLPDSELESQLVDRFASGSPRERQLAMLALAEGGVGGTDLVRRAAVDPDVQLRRRAGRAAAELGLADLLVGMLVDPSPAVRADALSALLDMDFTPTSELADRAIGDPSAAVRTVALRWAVEHPVLAAERILEALQPVAGDDRIDLEVEAVRALAARAAAAQEDASVVLEALEKLGRYDQYLVRREVAAALVAMGVSPFEVGPVEETRDLGAYKEILLLTSQQRWVRMETERGSITLRLDCPTAPLTCLSFLQLAEQGFFDGQVFHRVIPDFVVQGGDPSGGGWGGPGYTLRDEINPLRFEAGAIGMAHGGADTAGSQFFITLSRQPHLDGDYTVFGGVVRGIDVLAEIEQEDRLLRVREVGRPSAGGSAGLR